MTILKLYNKWMLLTLKLAFQWLKLLKNKEYQTPRQRLNNTGLSCVVDFFEQLKPTCERWIVAREINSSYVVKEFHCESATSG